MNYPCSDIVDRMTGHHRKMVPTLDGSTHVRAAVSTDNVTHACVIGGNDLYLVLQIAHNVNCSSLWNFMYAPLLDARLARHDLAQILAPDALVAVAGGGHVVRGSGSSSTISTCTGL